MKKGWKIALISLGSLLGLVVIVAAVALWLVFTPSQLTKIVNKLATNYVNCDTHFDRVNLTLFKTFPDAGLTVDHVYVVNPMSGAPSDTVARIGNLTVGVDVKKFLKEKKVLVHQVLLTDVQARLYVDNEGKSNFNIFPHSDKEKDTTKSTFSLDSLPQIDLRKIKVSNLNASFASAKNGIDAALHDLDLSIVGSLKEGRVDATLNLGTDRIALVTQDSTGDTNINAMLDNMALALKAEGNMKELDGKLKLNVKKGQFNDMVNERLQASNHDLLTAELPFHYRDDLSQRVNIKEGRIALDEYALMVNGVARIDSLMYNINIATDGNWQVAPLLALLPMQVLPKGMDVDGKICLDALAFNDKPGNTQPIVTASVQLADGRFHYPAALPYNVNRINGDLSAWVDLSKQSSSTVTVKNLLAHTRNTDLSVSGKVDNLLGDMHVDAKIKGSLPLEDAKPMLPDSLPLSAEGNARIDMHVDFKMSQLKQKAFNKMRADGNINFKNLDIQYDSIHLSAPDLAVAVQLPALKHTDKMADAHLSGSHLEFNMNSIAAAVDQPDINIGINNITREQLAATLTLALGPTSASLDSTQISLSSLDLSGALRLDSTQTNTLKKYNPLLDIHLRNAIVKTPSLAEQATLNDFDFTYRPTACEIRNADIKLGRSDFQLYGSVRNLEQWIDKKATLWGDLNFVSEYTDVDQLMDLFSGSGTDPDTLEQMRQEDNVPKDANPFIVPKDVDLTLHTHIHRSLAFGNDLGDVAGALTIKDGTAILDQIGFVCKAATMQLTALYRSPRPNNLFVALDFHLLDIQIDELLDMIPVVDTLVPMLSAFNGNANFHLAGEGYLNARYKPKMSTLLGSAAISGQNLVLLDNNSIAQIAKLMQFKSWKDKDNKIKVDSLSVEMTCLRREIEVFPFLLNIGKYQLCASGKHLLSGECGYHIELLKNPLLAKVGVDITGTLKQPKISLGQVRYADLYKPSRRGEVEKRTLEMKRKVRQALENNVR